MLGAGDDASRQALSLAVEKPEGKFHAEDICHGFIYDALVYATFAHLLHYGIAEFIAIHAHIVAGFHGESCRIVEIARDALFLYQMIDIHPVGDDKSLKSELIAQDIAHKSAMGGERSAVDGAVCRHDTARARLNTFGKGRKKCFAHLSYCCLGII